MATNPPKPGQYLLLYGSQTGQSQAIAEEIFERSPKHGLQPELHCMSLFGKKFQLEKERCVVMVTSSTGDGDPPDTALKFVRRFNRKILTSDHLAHISYTVLGLGDSNYGNFCNNAKNIDRRFSELGARRFHRSAFADEVEGLDVTADPWIDTLFPALQKLVGVCADSDSERTTSESTCVSGQDTSRCNGTHTEDQPHSDGLTTQHSSPSPSSASGSVSVTSSSAPLILNRTSTSVDEKENINNTVNALSASHSVGQSDRSETKAAAGRQNMDAESSNAKRIETLITRDPLSDNGNRQHVSENGDSHTAEECERQTLEDHHASEETTVGVNVKPSGDCDEVEQLEPEDTLELNAPVLDVPSLGVSGAALSEKTLTLPAATPAFLTATYLPADEGLSGRMATLPWQNGCKPPSAASNIVKARVVSALRLTSEDASKKTLLVTLSVKGSDLRYRPGDSISVICSNDDNEVSQLIKRLGLVSRADLPLKLGILPDTKKRRAAVPPHIPEEGATLRYILKNCINIREPPKKALLRHLVSHTPCASEKRRLQELCSKEGAEDYTAFVHGQHVSLLDVLYTFPSCQPPLERLIEHLPRLQPRPYSVCSCEDWEPGHLDIAFNVVTIPASNGRLYHRRGLCTGWLDDVTQSLQRHVGKEAQKEAEIDTQLVSRLETLSLADIEVQIFARTNQHFRTPSDLSLPLIMIGPGTGVAPYIGFLQERQLRLKKEVDGNVIGETWLLFGCRHKEKDFLFQSAIQDFQEQKVLTKFLPAFSRDSPASPDVPRYVQDNIHAHTSELCSLLHEKEAVVFVCGDAKHMAADVAAAFEAMFVQELGLSAEKAKEYLMTLRIRHRYLEDVWT